MKPIDDDFTDADILELVEKHKNLTNSQLSNSIKIEHLVVYEWRIQKEIADFDLKYPRSQDSVDSL